MANRLQAMGNPRYANGFQVSLHHDLLDLPLKWKKPRRIFVNSMSDLFHPDVPIEFIQQVFATIERAPQHTFQILTKRPSRTAELAQALPWPLNLWMGTSIESAEVIHRVASLQLVPAAIRFLSVEPLLGPIPNLPLPGIHWVIVGGESGPGARQVAPEWVREIRDRCIDSRVAFFFKQWGGTNKKATGRLIDGRTWDEFPEIHAVTAD